MKKMLFGAIVLTLAGCYTPLNNSGVATTKPWLEIPGKRVDYDGKQYDSCVQFNLRFWPQEAAERLDLQESCITACCWRSEKDEVVLDFNKKFDEEMEKYGHARKYFPEKITLKITHSNLVNVTKAKVSPRGAIKNSGLVKLSYKEVRDEKYMAQLEQLRQYRAQQQAYQPEVSYPTNEERAENKKATRGTKNKRVPQAMSATTIQTEEALAKSILQRQAGAQIDAYFYQMNQEYRKQGAVFMLSSRLLTARLAEDGTYLVTCHAKARTGIDQNHLNASDFPCGVWVVDLATQMVLPYDSKATRIQSAN